MILVIYKYTCARCGSTFDVPSPIGYGDFMMRSKGTGAPVTLAAIDDPVFAEVDQLLGSLNAYRGAAERAQADILHRAFSVACDVADDGTEYEIDAKPSCPVCHSREMASWSPTGDLWPESRPVPAVTHHAWERLTEAEKLALLRYN
jgi:hypothetical protein